MTEQLDELEIGIGRLKKNSTEQNRIIEELKRERAFLMKKNESIEDGIKKLQGQLNPAKSDIMEIKKELEDITGSISEIRGKDSKLQSMLTEQKSNLFLMKSRFEKELDKIFDDIDGKIKENKRIELSKFNELRSKIEKMMGAEGRLKDQEKSHKTLIDKLTQDISTLQHTVTELTAKRFDVELEKLSKSISSETKSLVKQIAGTAEVMIELKDRIQYFEPALKGLSDKFETQARSLNKLMDSREFLMKRSDVMVEEIKDLKDKFSSDAQRIITLEKERKERRREEEKMNKYLESAFQQAIESKSKELEAGVSAKSKSMETELKSLLKNLDSERERMSLLEQEFKNQVRDQRSYVKDMSSLEKTLSAIEERISISEQAIEKTVDSIKDIDVRFQQIMESKSRDFESGIDSKSKELESEIKIINKDLSSERERIASIEDSLNKMDANFQQSMDTKTRLIEDEVKSLTKDIISERKRLSLLEQDITNQTRNNDVKTKELDGSVKRIQINEAKREEGFGNMMGRLQELQIRTEESLKFLNNKMGEISRIEGNLEKKFHKENESIFKRLGSSYDKMDNRLSLSEDTLSDLDKSFKGLAKNFEDHMTLIGDAEKRISSLEGDVGNQSRDHESHAKDIDGIARVIDQIEERISTSEKMISRLEGLKDRITNLEELAKRTADIEKKNSISEKEIIRIGDSLKNLESRFGQSMEINTNELESALKSLTKDLASEKERVSLLEKDLKVQARDINKDITGRSMLIESNIESLTKDLASEKERISLIENDLKVQSKDVGKDIIGRSKLIEGNIESLTKNLESERERISLLEQEFKNQSKSHSSNVSDSGRSLKDLESSILKTLETKTKSLDDKIIDESKSIDDYLKAITKDLASEKERISLIEKDLKTQSMDQRSDSKEIRSLTDGIEKLEDRISDSEKIVSRVNEAVTAIRTRIMDEEEIAKRFEDQARVVDNVTNAGGRLARLEEKLKNQAKDHDMRFSELIGVIKDLELGESKRISEFNDFIDKFHRLREKTDQNLRMFSQNVKKMGDIKGEIKSEINKENLAKLKGFGLEFDGFKKRIGAVEELIIRFNDNMEKFKGDIGGISGRTRSAETTIKALTDKLNSERDMRVSLESKLKSYEKGRDILFSNINNLIKDIEVGEAKRIREYSNFITNFQQTKAKTEEAMKTMRSESNLLKKMNDDLSVKEMKVGDSLNAFTDEINSRMNVNEGMFDSEMDEFKNRLDGVSREMVSLKKMQQDFYDIIGIRKKTPATSSIDVPKSSVMSDAPKPMSFEKEMPDAPDAPDAPKPSVSGVSGSESIKPPPRVRKPSTKSLIKKLNPKSPYNE